MTAQTNHLPEINPLEILFTEMLPQSTLYKITQSAYKKNADIFLPNDKADRIFFVKKDGLRL